MVAAHAESWFRAFHLVAPELMRFQLEHDSWKPYRVMVAHSFVRMEVVLSQSLVSTHPARQHQPNEHWHVPAVPVRVAPAPTVPVLGILAAMLPIAGGPQAETQRSTSG